MALTVRIKKRYGDFLLDVDLAAPSGQALALLGASGSGKSVTLRCIAGIQPPDWGHIELDGRVLYDSEKRIDLPPQQRRVGYLFQQYALFPHMTVAQNIAAGLRPLNRSQRRRTAELIHQLRLEGLEDHRPSQLSGGQQQRTALARMLAAEPQVILLDEPLSALDSELRWQVETELGDLLSRFDGPALWVSHDRGEVYRRCAQVCVLDRGKSAPVLEMGALMSNPGTVSAARISGCENCASVRPGPQAGLVRAMEWHLTLHAAAPWREAVTALGVRAQHVRPAEAGAENAFPCRVVQVTEDIGCMAVLLLPEGAADGAPALRMDLDKAAWAALPDKSRILAAVAPEHIMLLE